MEEIALAEGALQDSKIALKKAEEQVSFSLSTTVTTITSKEPKMTSQIFFEPSFSHIGRLLSAMSK